MIVIWLIAFIFLAGLAYVRFAPSDVARWHVAPMAVGNNTVVEDKTFKNGVVRRVTIGKDGLRRFDGAVGSDPRSQVLAGSVEDGMVTYITRSRVVGYPDYTTALQEGEDLVIYARSRFGRSDLGVNKARVDRWISVLASY